MTPHPALEHAAQTMPPGFARGLLCYGLMWAYVWALNVAQLSDDADLEARAVAWLRALGAELTDGVEA